MDHTAIRLQEENDALRAQISDVSAQITDIREQISSKDARSANSKS